jgi:hypothetical protein
VSPHAPRQRLASPVGSRQATGPRRKARTGRVAGDGQPALLGLLGGAMAPWHQITTVREEQHQCSSALILA